MKRIQIGVGIVVLIVTIVAEIRMFHRLLIFWDSFLFNGLLSAACGKAFLSLILSAVVAQLLLVIGCALIGIALDKKSH